MALDAIKGLSANFNPFVKSKDSQESTNSTKAAGIGFYRSQQVGKKSTGDVESTIEKRPDGVSFMKEGALGSDDAVYVKGGRAGGLQNLIA